jgi:hypothetical protein
VRITISSGSVGVNSTVGPNSMLTAVELPALVTDLGTSLADMNGNNFSHVKGVEDEF